MVCVGVKQHSKKKLLSVFSGLINFSQSVRVRVQVMCESEGGRP